MTKGISIPGFKIKVTSNGKTVVDRNEKTYDLCTQLKRKRSKKISYKPRSSVNRPL